MLEHSANVNELVLKLGGWRGKTYPLRVTVDGKQAYLGRTPKSLGYVTLPLKATKGRTVRIELAGAIDEKDEFGMVEVTGKKLPDTADIGTPGALEVIEAEVYEPLNGGEPVLTSGLRSQCPDKGTGAAANSSAITLLRITQVRFFAHFLI